MKKITVIFLAVLLILGCFSFASCTGGNVTVEEGPLGRYTPNITVSYGKSINAVASLLTALGQTAEDNVWNNYIEDELGIKLKLTLGGSTEDDYYTKLVSTIATGNIPDFLEVGYFSNGFNNLKLLNDQELLANIGDIVEEYASDDLKSIIDSFDDIVFQPCTFEGELRGFPQFYNVGGASSAFYYIRTDWLENLNLQMPENYDELINVIKAFTNQDPDGDNQKNTYGLAADGSLFTSFAGIFSAFHSYPQAWMENGEGNLAYGGLTPETKAALGAIRELYADGCIKGDFTTLSPGTAATAQFNAGEAGIVVGVATSGLSYAQCVLRNNSAFYECIPFLSADSDPVQVISDIPAYTYYAVSGDAKYPEAMIKILNLFISVQETDDPELINTMISDTDGNEIWKLSPIGSMAKVPKPEGDDSYDQVKELAEAIKTRNDERLKESDKTVYQSVMEYLDKHVYKQFGWYSLFKENGSMQKLVEARENDYFVFSKYNAAPTDSMNEYLDSLNTLQWTAYASIICGEEQLDYFDTFVANWLSTGGQDVTDEVNEWYSQFAE